MSELPDAEPTPGRIRGTLRQTFLSLRNRNFRLYFIGQLISNTGNWLTNVALVLLVLQISHSGFNVGLLTACQYGPILFLSAWAGAIADRVDKRKMLLLTQSLEMAQSIGLAILAFTPHPPLGGLYALAAAGGILLAFDNPVRRSFVSEMVPPEDIPNAVVLYITIVNLSRIFGPALAGLLAVTVGFGWCFALDAATYLAVILCLILMRPAELYRTSRSFQSANASSEGFQPANASSGGFQSSAPSASNEELQSTAVSGRRFQASADLATTPNPTHRTHKGEVREGIRYVLSMPSLRAAYIMLAAIGMLSYNFTTTLPLFVTDTLHRSNAVFTILYSTFAVGAVVCALVVAHRNLVKMRHVIAGAASLGVTMLLLAFSPNVATAIPMAFLVGMASILYMTSTTAIAQVEAKPEMHGRVLALQTVLMAGTTLIGGPLLGWLADTIGGRAPILLGGAVALGAAGFGVVAGRGGGDTTQPDQLNSNP